uniref:Uncharacterized protein n=1 Tax=Homalodisca liturata TaxID=320908 RepID=A0A1B6J588_9HEMI
MYSSSSCQPSYQKRKRRASEDNEEDYDIENLPKNEEKKYRDDSRLHEPSCSFEREGEKRQPFSELKIIPISHDSNIEALTSDQERLSLSDDAETISAIGSCDVANLSDLSSVEEASPPCMLTPGTSSVPSTSSYQCEAMNLSAEDRLNPLPQMDWADLSALWQTLCEKDEHSVETRNPDMFDHHPSLQPRMRAVLLDWLSEVCDVYKLQRETYFMTIDYIDRYLSSQVDVPKQQLQLIGITCLQLATKNEEIYPPKMAEYAYVTDGACTEAEIIAKEIVICKALDWRLNPVTPISWLKTFLQICYNDKARHSLGFMFPQFSPTIFSRVAHLLNLCTLDISSLRFSYSTLAASALYLALSPHLATHVSGLSDEDLAACVDWMTPFWEVLKEEVPEYTKNYSKLLAGFTKTTMLDDSFNRQKHDISLSLLDSALSEAAKRTPSCLMTPPSSNKKNCTQDLTYT